MKARALSRVVAMLLCTLCVTRALAAEPGDLAPCINAARAAGAPKEVAEAMYLVEWNYPAPFAGIVCAAAAGGAKFHYDRGSWLRAESFEVAGKRHLRVEVARAAVEETGGLLLVPRSYQIDGATFQVDRRNIQQLAFQLRRVIADE